MYVISDTGALGERGFVTIYAAQAVALPMIAAGILQEFTTNLACLGCMTSARCGVMIADYYSPRGADVE